MIQYDNDNHDINNIWWWLNNLYLTYKSNREFYNVSVMNIRMENDLNISIVRNYENLLSPFTSFSVSIRSVYYHNGIEIDNKVRLPPKKQHLVILYDSHVINFGSCCSSSCLSFSYHS